MTGAGAGPLAGQVAVITGASMGIGRAVAETLAEDGATVVSIDARSAEDAGGAAFPGREVIADVADRPALEAGIDAIVDEHGRIDILVNNAGRDIVSPNTWDMDAESWARVLDVHLNGPWWATRRVVPRMIERGHGRIVFISSNAVRLGGFGIGHSPAYTAAKSGVIGLTVALSSQLEGHGIRVNAIAPGPTGSTGTPLGAQERADYERSHPLGFGGPEPIAHAVRYLTGPSGAWVSGAVMNVSGGEHRGI